MKEFSQVYKILKILRNCLDSDVLDASRLSPESLGISLTRRRKLLKMLQDKNYITDTEYPEITLVGLQYLEENSMMRKAAKLAKGIKDVI